MSMYNMINGVNTQVIVLFLPMLGKHYDDYPRFRDAFLSPMGWKLGGELGVYVDQLVADDDIPKERYIYIWTRVGGGNRPDYKNEIADLQSMPEYVKDYDDAFDS